MESSNLTRLYELNHERALELLPVIIYMCILSVVGVFGNSLILYIYYNRFKRSASSYFIICLAVLDMIACVLGMPFDAIDMRYAYIFDNPAACKALRFVIYYTVMGSALVLISIALDRYFKVCKPLKRVGVRMKYGVIGSLALSALLASPALAVFGTQTMRDLEPGVVGTDCSVSDNMQGTAWPIVYFIILVMVFLVAVVSLVLLYWRVVCALIKRKRQMQEAAGMSLTRKQKRKESVEEDDKRITTVSFKPTKDKEDDDDSNTRPRHGVLMAVPQSQWKVPTERTTAIFVCISIGFILSFLPCLLIMILREVRPEVSNFPNRAADIAYQVFLRSYFMNNVINPLIYGFFNPSFRREVKRLFWMCGCPCCEPAKVTGNGPSSSNDTTLTSGTASRN